MPEGDSLFRLAHRLRPLLAGRALTRAELRVPAHATADLTGWTVAAVEPRAKYLLIRLTPPADRAAEAAEPLTLLSHLKMEGRWIATALTDRWPAPGWQIRALLETAEHRFVGAQLGLLELIRTADEQQRLGFLGPDLLDPAWDAPPGPDGLRPADLLLTESVARLTADPARPVGLALLDQRLVSGIGNIYRCESLLLAGIDPHRPIGEVQDVAGLIELNRRLLQANCPPYAPSSSRPRRTTGVRPNPAAPFGVEVLLGSPPAPRTPDYWVYGRQRQGCLRCRGPVAREEFGSPEDDSRRLFWCRTCQR